MSCISKRENAGNHQLSCVFMAVVTHSSSQFLPFFLESQPVLLKPAQVYNCPKCPFNGDAFLKIATLTDCPSLRGCTVRLDMASEILQPCSAPTQSLESVCHSHTVFHEGARQQPWCAVVHPGLLTHFQPPLSWIKSWSSPWCVALGPFYFLQLQPLEILSHRFWTLLRLSLQVL